MASYNNILINKSLLRRLFDTLKPVQNVFKSSGRLRIPVVRCFREPYIPCRHAVRTRLHPIDCSLRRYLFGATFVTAGLGAVIATDRHANPSTADVKYLHDDQTRDPALSDALATTGIKIAFDWTKFWRFLQPDFVLLLGAVVSALVVAAVNVQIPVLLGDLVNTLPMFSLTDEAMENSNAFSHHVISALTVPALRLVYFYGIQSVFTFAYVSLLSLVGEHLASRLRRDLFATIVRLDIAFFDANKTGELVNRLTTDVQDFKSSFKFCVSQGLRSLAQAVGCFVSLYSISPQMTGAIVISLPLIAAVGSIAGSFLRRLSRLAGEQMAAATAVADEAIGNIRTVRAFAMEKKEIEIYEREVEKAARLNETLGFGIGVFQGVANVALNGIVLSVMCMGGYLISTNNLSAGELMSFLAATQTIQRSLAQLSLLFGQYVRGVAAGARIFEYASLKPRIPLEGGQKIAYHSLQGDVEFRNVSFAYPTRPEQTIFSDFNLKIPAGRVVALCGPSGGGKSTIAALLERFYDVDSGLVTLNGVDVRSLDGSWLRGRVIGFINQEPVLFATSVMENIRYGRPDATDQEVMEAANSANADEFIRSFPDGYRTVLGERGVTVSGGQKQRIAIARALLKNPSILILDEATSALDADSEKQVQDALDNVVKGRTVLVIAHRLSTIQKADLIVVLSGGVVAEMGTDATLRKKRGLYWNLVAQQQIKENH